jgi:hypothetical protein
METLKIQAWKSQEIYDAYFACEEKTPDLVEMFGIRGVKRTSSAIWTTPPCKSSKLEVGDERR